MVDITNSIGDSIYPQVLTDFCTQNHYQDTIQDPQNLIGPQIPNPESKDQFMARKMGEFAFESYQSGSAVRSANAARDQAIAAADANKPLFTSKTSVVPIKP